MSFCFDIRDSVLTAYPYLFILSPFRVKCDKKSLFIVHLFLPFAVFSKLLRALVSLLFFSSSRTNVHYNPQYSHFIAFTQMTANLLTLHCQSALSVPFVMAALRSICGHYIFGLCFLLSSFFSFLRP